MTFHEFIVPVLALCLAGVAVVYVHWLERRLERQMREQDRRAAE